MKTQAELDEISDARNVLEAAGFVVLREKSYRQAQQRQRIAESLLLSEKERREDNRGWALKCLDEQRRLADRLVFVYGVARAHGATVEELRSPGVEEGNR